MNGILTKINSYVENRVYLNKDEVELKKFLYVEEKFWKQKAGIKMISIWG